MATIEEKRDLLKANEKLVIRYVPDLWALIVDNISDAQANQLFNLCKTHVLPILKSQSDITTDQIPDF